MNRLSFRPARFDEADLLNEMNLAGLRYHRHHETAPEAYARIVKDLHGPTPDEHTYVAMDDDELVGFFGLIDRVDFVELWRFFLTVNRIGRGYGRELWVATVEVAAQMSHLMKIKALPGATGFYDAMGARYDEMVEVGPKMELAVYWYDLR